MANLLRLKQNTASNNPKREKLGLVVILILIVTAVALTFTTYAAISTNRRVEASGSVTSTANLGIYSDSTCQIPLTSIEWGAPTPGTSIARIIYVKNTGVGASLSLGLITSNWDPTIADGPITVSLDKTGTRLSPGQSTAACITLTVSPTTVDINNFSLVITITGNQ